MRDRFIATLTEIARQDPRIVLMTGDLGFGVVDDFRARFPDRFINAGVAEQNMTMLATGMALEGAVVFTYSIANFPTLRCLEMIRNDAAYHAANVKVVAIGGGFSYGSLGISHHATEDLAILRSLPDVTVWSPGNLLEVEAVTRLAVSTPGTCYLRLDKDKGPDGSVSEMVKSSMPRLIKGGRDVALLATGGILSQAVEASDILRASGIEAAVFSVHTLRPMDRRAFVDIAASFTTLVTIEEHTLFGGLGSAVLEVLADAGAWPRRFLRIGLEGVFSSTVGSQHFLRQRYGLDAATIAARVLPVAAAGVRQ